MPHSRSISVLNTGEYCSNDEFRYSLTRSWDSTKANLLYVMRNPSKAKEVLNDETVMACQNLAWLIGHPEDRDVHTELIRRFPRFGSIRVCNLYPGFATSPDQMTAPPPEVLAENDRRIECACRWADKVICAWGAVTRLDRARVVERVVRDAMAPEHILCFGLTKEKQPIHPIGVKQLPGTHRQSLENKMLLHLQLWESS